MSSTNASDWWNGEINWETPAGALLQRFKPELQNAVDLFRPSFNDESPNRYPDNTRRLWRELFDGVIDLHAEIIAPALARRRAGYGETPPDYKRVLGD